MAKDTSGKKQPAKGDKVAWRTHGTETTGTVQRKITERTEAAGRTVDASPDDPQYEVRSDKSGRPAVHKPSALKREEQRGSGGRE
ncbi:hypervirulence associated TUDOR domain-containing protein [Streptomyces sennicomposti]